MRVVVNDANILIDLIDAGLLDLFFKLKFEMNIADSVINEFENEDDVTRINKFINSRVNARFWDEQYEECSNQACAIYQNLLLANAFPEWDFK